MNKIFVLWNESQARSLWLFLKNNAKAMADAGKPLEVSVGPHKRKRTSEQNRMLHRLLTILEEDGWVNGRQYDMETWKEHFRRTYIGVEEVCMPTGEIEKRGISTTTLEVEEFSLFLEKVMCFMTVELGIEIDVQERQTIKSLPTAALPALRGPGWNGGGSTLESAEGREGPITEGP